ncbi:hypothetical protein NIES4073_51440 [Kalymmatonema gypsitolerans NIES-4073]|nr:hypothetical protein NIES4073_51440 [Scytonema sp. NIES-4073]
MGKLALLIGVSEYQPGLNPLPSAVKDVEAMRRVLTHPEIGNFAEVDITVLKNPQRQEMEDAIYNLFAHRQKEDLLLFYFSGHGIKDDNGRLYLSTSTTRKQNDRLFKPSAVAASVLHENMNESRSQRQVIILDCCFSGAIAQGLTVKDDGTVNLQEQLGGKGRAILTSSTSTQYSFEQAGSDLSIYTRYLVEGMEKGAADRDGDGWISIDELHEYASDKVKEAAPAMTPKFYPIEEGHKILLAKSPKDDPKVKYRKEVESRAKEGHEFSVFARRILDGKRNEWGLTPEEAAAIEEEVLQPYREYERFTQNLGNDALLEMVAIPGGQFLMGSPENQPERYSDESPQHTVTIQPFYIAKFPVTQAQWKAVAALPRVKIDLNPDPSSFKGANRPVEKVSWDDAIEFCVRLSRFVEGRLSNKTGKLYRLPSEAEWEYACRAGTTTPFHFGETITTDLANYDGKYTYGSGPKGEDRQQTTEVGKFPPNAFGLYDMHGNICEWCQDAWHDSYEGAPADGTAWMSENNNDSRLLRGGSWYDDAWYCRSAARDWYPRDDWYDSLGFRVVVAAFRTS